MALLATLLSAGIEPAVALPLNAAAAAPAAPAAVIPVVAASTQFDVTGFLESATLDTPADTHSGGTATINGQTIIIPRETIVILPANALTWQELFSHAPAPYGLAAAPPSTGMALNDVPKPLTTYEVQVVGNRVKDPSGVNGCAVAAGCDRMIAGLVHVSQQDLNSGAGYVSFINYATGEMEVGGKPGVAGTGARLRINDPANATSGSGGRFGRAMTPDDRFQVDQDNPTILAETGFPMCIPRSDPAGATPDALCPESNRPDVSSPVVDTSGITPQPNTLIAGQPYTLFRMDSPANVDAGIGCLRTPCADPRKQAPFEIGDYVTFAGTKINDGTAAAPTYYTSAHTITASLGIYTQPGVDPAYVSTEVALIGTGGLTVFGAGEAAVRTRFEGMTTDESRMIRIYGVDINPITGVTTDREWGTIMPDAGPPTGAVRGRWRFRPPCTAVIPTDKACTPPPAGQFIPPTREVRAVITGLSQYLPGTITPNPASQVPGTPGAKTTANGIYYGQYHAPIGEYIFPENVPGTAVPENNFNTINFLAYGGYQSITGVQAGVLNPWPSSVIPSPAVCATPTLNGAPYSVANGGSIQLSGSVTAGATSPVSLNWTAGTGLYGTATGTNLNGALTGATTTTPTFNATGLAAGTYNVNLEASNICGVAVASSTITVRAAPPPTINPIQNQTVTAGATVTIAATSSSLPTPTWAWTQTSGPAGPIPPNAAVAFLQTPAAATASGSSQIQFTAATVGTYTFSVRATNANGTSPATSVTITATASVPTTITFGGTLEYRIAKQRLVMTATSTNPAITSMVLQPYLTEAGTVFDPATLGANLTVSLVTPGSFTITAVGAPKPACNLGGTYATPCSKTPITVKGFVNGVLTDTSAPSAMDRIRQ
jgi:hypothetical protein